MCIYTYIMCIYIYIPSDDLTYLYMEKWSFSETKKSFWPMKWWKWTIYRWFTYWNWWNWCRLVNEMVTYGYIWWLWHYGLDWLTASLRPSFAEAQGFVLLIFLAKVRCLMCHGRDCQVAWDLVLIGGLWSVHVIPLLGVPFYGCIWLYEPLLMDWWPSPIWDMAT